MKKYRKIITESGEEQYSSIEVTFRQHGVFNKGKTTYILPATKEEYISSPEGKSELVKIRFSQNKPLPL